MFIRIQLLITFEWMLINIHILITSSFTETIYFFPKGFLKNEVNKKISTVIDKKRIL